jgi:YcxB-like protein
MTQEPELRSHPVSYDLDDVIALSKLTPRGPLQILRIAAGAIVILFTFTIVAEVWSLTGILDWGAITVCLIVAAILLFVSNRRVRARFWLRVMRLSPLHSAHSYAITPATLRISSPKGVFDVRWTAFTDIKRTADRLFAFMNHRQAYVVPRRAFDSDEEFNAFVAAAQEHWEQSHRL